MKQFKDVDDVQQDQTLWEKIKQAIKHFIGLFKDTDDIQRDLNKIAKKLSQMESNLAKQKTSTEKGEVRKSINISFENEIDAWVKNGQPNDETFILGTTGDVLQGLGAIESDIYMLSEKINIILKDHPEMTINEIKKIPQILENPTLILKSKTQKTSLVIFGTFKAQDGRPILCSLNLRPVENNLVVDDMQKVTSAYSKDNDPIKFIKSSQVVYADKNKTTKLLKSIGIQTPIELQQSGYIGNISYFKRSVNIEGKKFNDVFKENITDNRKSLTVDSEGNTLTEAQQEYFKDSKVRDENGNLMVVYHGTDAEFTVFNTGKKVGWLGKGIYFTNNKKYARKNGKRILSTYLDIKNPFMVKGKSPSNALSEIQSIFPQANEFNMTDILKENGYNGIVYTHWDEDVGKIFVIFNSNQAKLTTNENPTESEDIRYSKNIDISKLEEKHQTLQDEYNSLNKEVEEIKNSEEYKKFVDDLSTISPGEELDELIKEYGRWQHKVGLYKKSKRMSEIIGEQKDIRAIIEDDNKNSREAFMLSIENLDDNEKLEYVNKAVERYGTTNNVKLASYLLLNGDMLDFSSGQGYRVQDHREISEILDMPESAEYSDGLIAFMNMGNIRLQTYGIDISQAPNNEQKSTLRDIISQVMRANDEFTVDFSKTSGYTDGSVTYPKGTSSSKILADIDSYFKDGVVPEYASSIADYRYSKNIDLSNVEDYENRYLYKKPIKVSKQEWSAINSRRTQRYGDKSENEMPSVDFFIVGTYNNLNKGFEYYIVNYDKYSFSVVAKKKLKDYGVVNNNDTRRKTNLETTRDGLQEGLYSGNNISNRDGRRGGKNAYSYEEQPQNDRPTVNNGGGSDGRVFTSTEDRRKSLNIDLTTLPDSELSDAVENETITIEQAEQELMRRYGKIPNSFKPKQNIVLTVEETQKEGFATSEFVDNVLRNGKFDADMTDEQKAEILKAAKAHKIITDKAALKRVETALANNYEGAVAEWQSYINVNNKSIKQIGKNEIALGQQLLQHAAENGNVADTVKYLAELTEAATRAGQTVQAFYVLKIF